MTQGYHEYTDTSEDDARSRRWALRHARRSRDFDFHRRRARRRLFGAAVFVLGLMVFAVVKKPDHVEVPERTATAAESVTHIDAGLRDVLSRITDPAFRFAPEYSKTDDPGGCGANVGTTAGWGMVAPEVRYTASVASTVEAEAQLSIAEIRARFVDAAIELSPAPSRDRVDGTREGVHYVAEYRMAPGGARITLVGTGECVWPDGSQP